MLSLAASLTYGAIPWSSFSFASGNDGLQFVKLPDEIDLGNAADSAMYARASTRVLGKRQGDTLTMRGAPILFAFSIPTNAENPSLAEKFVAYVISADGRRVLRPRAALPAV